jgi:2-keto-4-pentenoate hydratase
MTHETRFREAAQFLLRAHELRLPFAPIPTPYAPQNVEEVYAVHEELLQPFQELHGPLAGYKIAFTTPVMREMAGFHEPVAGFIFARTVHKSPAILTIGQYVHLGIECEIAFRMGDDLPVAKAPYSAEDVAHAVSEVATAFELVDDRNADLSQLSTVILSASADNVWNAGAVLGEPVTDWRGLDLAAAQGKLTINGQVMGQGVGADVLGHPLDALTWLVNMLANRGKSIPAEAIVLTGSIVALKFLHLGDHAVFSVDGLGDVSLKVA